MDRLARHLLQRNPDTLKDAELLELLLRFAVGENDASALAQRLLERWPCLASVLEADAQELSAVEGMTDECAVLLRLVPELQRRYLIARSAPETRLVDSVAFGGYLLPYFYGAKDEMVYLLSLDATGKPLSCRLIGHGSVNSANVPVRRLVQEALTANATAVVLAHNHPSGTAEPSQDDYDSTRAVISALNVIGVRVIDHLIFAGDSVYSMTQSSQFDGRQSGEEISYLMRSRNVPGRRGTLREEQEDELVALKMNP